MLNYLRIQIQDEEGCGEVQYEDHEKLPLIILKALEEMGFKNPSLKFFGRIYVGENMGDFFCLRHFCGDCITVERFGRAKE